MAGRGDGSRRGGFRKRMADRFRRLLGRGEAGHDTRASAANLGSQENLLAEGDGLDDDAPQIDVGDDENRTAMTVSASADAQREAARLAARVANLSSKTQEHNATTFFEEEENKIMHEFLLQNCAPYRDVILGCLGKALFLEISKGQYPQNEAFLKLCSALVYDVKRHNPDMTMTTRVAPQYSSRSGAQQSLDNFKLFLEKLSQVVDKKLKPSYTQFADEIENISLLTMQESIGYKDEAPVAGRTAFKKSTKKMTLGETMEILRASMTNSIYAKIENLSENPSASELEKYLVVNDDVLKILLNKCNPCREIVESLFGPDALNSLANDEMGRKHVNALATIMIAFERGSFEPPFDATTKILDVANAAVKPKVENAVRNLNAIFSYLSKSADRQDPFVTIRELSGHMDRDLEVAEHMIQYDITHVDDDDDVPELAFEYLQKSSDPNFLNGLSVLFKRTYEDRLRVAVLGRSPLNAEAFNPKMHEILMDKCEPYIDIMVAFGSAVKFRENQSYIDDSLMSVAIVIQAAINNKNPEMLAALGQYQEVCGGRAPLFAAGLERMQNIIIEISRFNETENSLAIINSLNTKWDRVIDVSQDRSGGQESAAAANSSHERLSDLRELKRLFKDQARDIDCGRELIERCSGQAEFTRM